MYASGVAFFATGLSVSAGVAAKSPDVDGALVNLSAGKTQLTKADLADREQSASRSTGDRRVAADSLKAAELTDATGVAVTRTEDLTKADPRTLTLALMPQL